MMRQKRKKMVGVILAVVVLVAIGAIVFSIYANNKSKDTETEAGHFVDTTAQEEEVTYTDMSEAKAGDIVAFGNYDDNKIAWKVLEKKDDELLLLTDKCIAKQAYHDKDEAVDWQTSELRKWLNETFYTEAFSDDEKTQIIQSKVVNKDNEAFNTKGGKTTKDYVYLLSIDEVTTYLPESPDRSTTFTDGSGGWWWLRSPGFQENDAANIGDYGAINHAGHKVYDKYVVNGGVRPVIRVKVQ